MTAWVNLFAHGPLRKTAVNASSGTLSFDSIMAVDPPIGRAYFAALDTVTPQPADPAFAPVGTELLCYEVQAGKLVAYERCNANGTLRTPDAQSPTLEGKGYLSFGQGWKISLLERTP